MSNINSNIFNNSFDSYGRAVDKVLKDRGLSKTWLAKQIRHGDVKLASLQSQISRWVKGDPVGEDYQERINKSLDITIKQNSKGDWIIEDGYRSLKSRVDVDLAKQKASQYRGRERSLDDLPEILRLKNELEEWIDELLRTEHDDPDQK